MEQQHTQHQETISLGQLAIKKVQKNLLLCFKTSQNNIKNQFFFYFLPLQNFKLGSFFSNNTNKTPFTTNISSIDSPLISHITTTFSSSLILDSSNAFLFLDRLDLSPIDKVSAVAASNAAGHSSSSSSTSSTNNTTTTPKLLKITSVRGSLKKLCETMSRQILTRAFYGWLAHHRNLKTVGRHLTG